VLFGNKKFNRPNKIWKPPKDNPQRNILYGGNSKVIIPVHINRVPKIYLYLIEKLFKNKLIIP